MHTAFVTTAFCQIDLIKIYLSVYLSICLSVCLSNRIMKYVGLGLSHVAICTLSKEQIEIGANLFLNIICTITAMVRTFYFEMRETSRMWQQTTRFVAENWCHVLLKVELTNDLTFVLPIMVSIISARWVASMFTHALYHQLIEYKCIPFLDWELVVHDAKHKRHVLLHVSFLLSDFLICLPHWTYSWV